MAFEEQDSTDGWQTFDDWISDMKDDSEIIRGYFEETTFKEKLRSLESNLERFTLFWEDDKLREEIERLYRRDLEAYRQKAQSMVRKSSDVSMRWRESGNKSFKNGDFILALRQYTQAIKYAPNYEQEDGTINDSLAVAYANRSAALYALTRYRSCLLDIELAIKYGYPEQNMFKLLIRKVKCLHILSVWTNDVEQIKDSLKKMLMSRDTKEFVKTEIQNMFEFLEITHPEDMEKDESDMADDTVMRIPNVSKSVAQAADCIEMSYDSEKGRYLILNKDISFGRMLMSEEPFVSNLAIAKRNDYCYNCLGRLNNCGVNCIHCTQILYCSEDCRDQNSKIHKKECNGFLEFQEKFGVAYLVAHIMFKINFDLTSFPIYSKKNVDMKTLDDILAITASDWPDLVYKNDYAAVLSLMDHADCYPESIMLAHGLASTYMMTAMVDHFAGCDTKLLDIPVQLLTGSIVLRHLLQLGTNLISILDQNILDSLREEQPTDDIHEEPIGAGIYPTISLLNHSCRPNVLPIFHRNKFIVCAGKDLECGTEINYCYGPCASRDNKEDRQRKLKEQYFFTCNCECCAV